MSDEVNLPNDPQTETPASDVSPETKALVDEKLPAESDEIKYHLTALIDAIKKQAQTQIESAGDSTREVYVSAMRQAQETLKRTGIVLDDQRSNIDSYVTNVEDIASQNWENLLQDFQKWGDRVDRAFNAAWRILTEDHKNDPPDSGHEATDQAPTEVEID